MGTNPEFPAGAAPSGTLPGGIPPPAGYPAQAVTQYPPPNVPIPQEGMVQVNPEKLQGVAGPSNAYPPPNPSNAYPPPNPSNAYPPPGAYPPPNEGAGYPPPAPGAYPPGAYPPAQPVEGIPVGYPGGPQPGGYAGGPGGPPGVMYTSAPAPPMGADEKASGLVCVAITLMIVGIFFPICWLVVALLPLCARSQNLKTQLLLRRLAIGATVALLVYLVIAVILAVVGGPRWRSNSSTRVCRDPYTGRTFYC